ncbi:Gfo/Idh/MocA family oxidoreductase [Candidatus Marinimicrobia bacterium]|nr:Gfo/Idh/MocA family oxidoreductase [Candidatus Neomarinimicrobiota bacterium]
MNKKICVVGAGYWGQNHIKTLSKLNSLGGIVDLDKETLNKTAKHYPGIKHHLKIRDALDVDYDGFVVATPAQTHLEIAEKIIKSQKNLLIEKPMTLCIEDAKKIVNLAEKFNVNVIVGHLLLFHPAIKKIKKMIVDKEIGDLQYIYSNRLNLGKVRTEENVFWSFAPHDIAVFQYLTGSIPDKINATGSAFLQEGIPDSTLTQLEYKSGVKGHIFVSWLHPFKEHRLIVIGSKAMISYEDSLDDKPLKFYSKKIDFDSGFPKKIDGPVDVVSFKGEMPLELELKYFIRQLSGEKISKSNVYDGYEVVKTLVKASNQLL